MGRNPKWWKDPVLVTVLVAIVTGAWAVSSRMSSLEARMIERFGALEARMIDRFGAMEARMAAIEARMDLLLESLDITVTPRK